MATEYVYPEDFFESGPKLATKDKPEIKVKQGEAPRVTDEAEEILMEHAEKQKIFQRSGELVRIIRLPAARKDSRLSRPAGTVTLEPMSQPALMETLDRLISFVKWNAKLKKPVNTDCPGRIASAYMSRRGSWRLPVLTGTVSAPLMRLDGSLLIKTGYDEETGLYLDSEEVWLPVAENPTRDDAVRALEVLHEPFKQFPFVGPEDKAVLIACILTAIQRRLLAACPLFGFRAPQPRSGKSLAASSAAIIATGKPAPAAAVSPDQEELRKAFTAALREGLPIINLDNIERALKSPDLAKILTEEEFQDRLLGESTTLRLPTNCLWTATGNNLTFRGDLTQRVLLCRIDAKLKQPEQREFQIPNLKAHLLKHRPELVCAALTILRAFHVAGRPPQRCPVWGGFEEWSDLIRQSLIWTGETDPFLTRETVIEEDPEKESAIEVFQQLANTFGDAAFTAREIILKATDETMDDHRQRRHSYPELRGALLAATGGAKEIESGRLSWWLRIWRDRFAGDLRLFRANPETTKPAKWKVTNK